MVVLARAELRTPFATNDARFARSMGALARAELRNPFAPDEAPTLRPP